MNLLESEQVLQESQPLKARTKSTPLAEEYGRQRDLFAAQPALIQRFFEAQAKQVADVIVNGARRFGFALPDQVICTLEQSNQPTPTMIPASQRVYSAGIFFSRFGKSESYKELRHVLNTLEQSPNYAVVVASGLLRYAVVRHVVHNVLPAGVDVVYAAGEKDEALPYLPVDRHIEDEQDELLTPFVPYARRFYLPQWVAFDGDGSLLTNSVEEAEAQIKSMQKFMEALFACVALAPYISADAEYQQKRYGMLGQLVNQARALAAYHARGIIATIRKRAAARNLNRGLWLSLPYFDDQSLRVEILKIEVIPAGRIAFLPAFVVRAVRQEQAKVSQDTRLSSATRRHLLSLLDLLEQAFEDA